MRIGKRWNRIVAGVFMAALLLQIAACSSSNETSAVSAQTSDTAGESNTAITGQVSLLLTDKPTEDFDEINITVNSWSLLGDGDPVLLSDAVETFNLLDLRNSYDLVVGAVEVPVGSYSKIRLDVELVELVDRDVDGNVIATEYPKLPSGKIDFVFSGDIVVAPDSRLVLKIDMEADNSIHYHATGNDKYIFRPVVRIEVESDAADAVIRLSGVVFDKQPAPGAQMFVLCAAGSVVVTNDCASISIKIGTTFLGSDMLPGNYTALSDGDEVLLFGLFNPNTGGIDAIRVLRQSYDGDNKVNLISLMADFGGAVAAGRAPLLTTSDSIHVPAGTALDADLINAQIANQQGMILNASAVDAGVGAEVFGILRPDNASPVELRAGFVILDEPATP